MTDPVVQQKNAATAKPKKKRSIVRHIKAVAPFVRAGVGLLSKVRKVGPYARVLQEVISIGAEALPDEQAMLLIKMKKLQQQIREAKNARTAYSLRTQMDTLIDILLETSGI